MRALWISLLRFVPLPVVLVALNIYVDPVRVASGDEYERGIAGLLLEGIGVTNIANPKDAAVVQYVLEGLEDGPDVIVLGSSRSKLIREQFFGKRSFFNNAVAGGGLTDYLALYGLYRQRQFMPKLIVLEMSPWLLDPTYTSVWEDRYPPRVDLERDVREGRALHTARYRGVRQYFDRLKELVSPGYFQTSLMTLARQARLGSKENLQSYFPFESGDVPLRETVLPDGSVIYGERAWNETTRQQIRAQAVAYAARPQAVPREIDLERVALLEAFVRRVQRDGAEVILYLPPYHPETYDRMLTSRDNARLPDVEHTLHALAMRTNSTIIGSFDPRNVGLGEDDFFDPSHPDADAVARLFEGRWTSPGSEASSDARIVGIVNPNGIETRNNRPFFWIGQGAACISLKSAATGWAKLSFWAEPGPSRPQTSRRRVLVTSTADFQPQVVSIEMAGELSIVVPTIAGVSDVCLTALDGPTVTNVPGGDPRPLILGAAEPRVEAVATAARSWSVPPCSVTFSRGWYPPETDTAAWHRWMSGSAEIIISASAEGGAVLTGSAIAMTRPDRVDITIGESVVGEIDISDAAWAFRPFLPVNFEVRKGETRLVLQSLRGPVTQTTDPRSLAVALQNLNVTLDASAVPCGLQP